MSSEVSVTVPARADFVRLLRGVAATVGARMDLTYDRLDDLRIAVDEAAAQLLETEASSLTMRVQAADDGVSVVVCADAGESVAWPPEAVEESLAWRVLSGIADEVRFERTDDGPTVRIRMEARAA